MQSLGKELLEELLHLVVKAFDSSHRTMRYHSLFEGTLNKVKDFVSKGFSPTLMRSFLSVFNSAKTYSYGLTGFVFVKVDHLEEGWEVALNNNMIAESDGDEFLSRILSYQLDFMESQKSIVVPLSKEYLICEGNYEILSPLSKVFGNEEGAIPMVFSKLVDDKKNQFLLIDYLTLADILEPIERVSAKEDLQEQMDMYLNKILPMANSKNISLGTLMKIKDFSEDLKDFELLISGLKNHIKFCEDLGMDLEVGEKYVKVHDIRNSQ